MKNLKMFYVSDESNERKIEAENSTKAAQLFCEEIIKEILTSIKSCKTEDDLNSIRNKMVLGEYIYTSEKEYFARSKRIEKFNAYVSVTLLRSIGQKTMAEIMDANINEIESYEKLKQVISPDQKDYLEKCIGKLNKDKEIKNILK